jgi:hypothetical protein
MPAFGVPGVMVFWTLLVVAGLNPVVTVCPCGIGLLIAVFVYIRHMRRN